MDASADTLWILRCAPRASAGLALLGFLLLTTPTFAATYYVDWDTGTDCPPPACGTQSNPWQTPWHADGQVSDGDTVIVYAKNDGSPYNNGTSAVLSVVTPNTTWQAAVGETVRFSITSTFGDKNWIGGGFILVNLGAANVVFDGFYVWGQVHIDHLADNAIIQNCDLSGGNGGRDNFPSPIYIHGSYTSNPHVLVNATTGVLIQNNRVHDNVTTGPETPGNSPLMMVYASRSTVVENNEFYGSYGPAVWWKVDPGDETVRYNYFHDSPDGTEGCSSFCAGWIEIHNNVFSTLTGYGVGTNSGGALGYLRVRNNTFYNVDRDFGWWAAGANGTPELFNNIHYHSVTGAHHLYVDESTNWTQAYWPYLDYNNYFVSGVTTNWFINSANRASTLSGWQTWLDGQGAGSANGDDNSVATDPNFLNGSGVFTAPADFKRSSYPTDGRGGVWPSVMGAYVTGNEIIGIPPSGTPPDTIAPSSPTGLSATATSSSQINLSWAAATDNVGVTGYRLYRDGVLIASPAGTAYDDAGLVAGTTYSYRVAAVDGAGNASGQSPAVVETTMGAGGGAPPGIGGGGGCGTIRLEPPSSGGSALFLVALFWPLAVLAGRKLYGRCCSA